MNDENEILLTEETFLAYCFRYYDNPSCYDFIEFHEDLRRIKYIKKLFTRYETNGELKERLILNHIIILNNVFGPEHTSRILFFKIEEKHWPYLKPFLILLSILPSKIVGIQPEINTDDIDLDSGIVEVLRKI